MNWIKFLPVFFILSGCGACKKVSYDLKGSNIPADVNTFSVEYFNNEAQLVNPNLSILFTEKVKSKFQNQTKLNLVTSNGDYSFAGAIRDYKVIPATIDANSGAAQNQFTITVKVFFTCNLHPEKNFTRDFTFFRTFDATKDFSTVEATLADEITDNIVQQIFAATALDW